MNAVNKTLLAAAVTMGLSACAATSGKANHDLDFSKQPYTEQSMVVNGETIKFRAYEGIVYVKNPIDAEYEVMNIYVPEQYYQNGSIDGFTAEQHRFSFPIKLVAICLPSRQSLN